MKHTTLAVMAAGIGSRFGKGIKQLEPLGPNGEIIMDYSINDAIEAGFDKVVFIIRKDLEKDFREIIGSRMEKKITCSYAFQELDDLPGGFKKPEGRTKPWGTGQAILACKGLIQEPFAVINADDYYGKKAFRLLHDYLIADHPTENGIHQICMAGFRLGNTLSENGGVTRGVCVLDSEKNLIGVNETQNIIRTSDGAAVHTEQGDTPIDVNAMVSMNMWGLQSDFIDLLDDAFKDFLAAIPEGDLKKEFLLPTYIDQLLHEGRAVVKVLDTDETWFGVTYQEDKDSVKRAFADLCSRGVYGRLV
ncbi:MAG: nucleotidyltransferase [Eubacterium sp.]|nr:nucleotidyltransferase [Eubacterium sp.]